MEGVSRSDELREGIVVEGTYLVLNDADRDPRPSADDENE